MTIWTVPRTIFDDDHETFRASVRRFIADEITPFHQQWEREGCVSRQVWQRAGAAGLLCITVAPEYGGPGGDIKYAAICLEEMNRAGATGPGFSIHSEMAAGYISNFGSHEQKLRWLPKMASGENIAALALTEPDAGSDLKAIRTTAQVDGDDYVISGQKTYISNGQLCDIVVVACKTDPKAGAKGMSFLVVETCTPGFERGRRFEKIGLRAQDTSELFFNDVRVPIGNRLGEEGQGFSIAVHNLAEERLSIAISAVAACQSVLEYTVEYVQQRKAFGTTIASFQNTRFKVSELIARTQALRVFVDRCVELAFMKQLDSTTAAMAKMLTTEHQCRVVDECLQFYGGAGYMMENKIAGAYMDARIRRIAGGSSEVMREIIGRNVFGK